MGAKCGKGAKKQVRQDKVAEDEKLARQAEEEEKEKRRAAEEQKFADEQKAFEAQKKKFAAEQQQKTEEAKKAAQAAMAQAEKEKEEQKQKLEEQQKKLAEQQHLIKELKEKAEKAIVKAQPPPPPPPMQDDAISRMEAERLQLDQERETLEIQKQRLAEETRAADAEMRKMKEIADQLKQELDEEREKAKLVDGKKTKGGSSHETGDANLRRIPSITEFAGRRVLSSGGGVGPCGFASLSSIGHDVDSWGSALAHNFKSCFNSFRDPAHPPEYIHFDPGESYCFRQCGCGVEPHNRRKCLVCRRMDLSDSPILQ